MLIIYFVKEDVRERKATLIKMGRVTFLDLLPKAMRRKESNRSYCFIEVTIIKGAWK